MPKKLDLTDQKFGKWTAKRAIKKEGYPLYFWECECECGTVRELSIKVLKEGKSKSCGCGKSDFLSQSLSTHGKSKSSEYEIWAGMKKRCYKPNSKSYKNYGARGITVCDRWLNSFENFLEDMGLRPSPNHTLERLDNDGPYSPDNCRWATKKEQANNVRTNHLITYQGRTQTMAQWAEELGIKYSTLRMRINNYSWSIEKALTSKADPKEAA